MTPELQRIKIAEACGWREVTKSGPFSGQIQGITPSADNARPAQALDDRDGRQWYWVPNYLHDLNAMHEAELALLRTDDLMATWIHTLRSICSEFGDSQIGNALAARATAAQRAEAFLRTLDLWEEE